MVSRSVFGVGLPLLPGIEISPLELVVTATLAVNKPQARRRCREGICRTGPVPPGCLQPGPKAWTTRQSEPW